MKWAVRKETRERLLRLAIVWLAIVVLADFWLTVREISDPVSLSVAPEAPREGEPILVTWRLNNPSVEVSRVRFEFYANGSPIQSGTAMLPPLSARKYQYAYLNSLPVGRQFNFSLSVWDDGGSYQKSVSTPPYPPQVWSSFVSFATFATSVMSSMSTMTYYQDSFLPTGGFNVGMLVSVVLIGLLIFLELFQPAAANVGRMGRLRARYAVVSVMLLVIFLGLVYTKVVLILAT